MSSPDVAGLAPATRLRAFVSARPTQLALLVALAVYLHARCWAVEAPDMHYFLRPWFEHMVKYGPVAAFAHPFGDYTPTYLYLLGLVSLAHGSLDAMSLIKLLSVAGTGFAAVAVAELVDTFGGRRSRALLLFIVPSVVINAALLAQCDALWAGACVLAIAAMIRGSTTRSLIWCGVAISFKLQAVFIAPFIIGSLIGRRAPLWQWTIPALTFAALMAPAWLAGWPAWDLLMIYPNQTGTYGFAGNLANAWMIAEVSPDTARHFFWAGYAAAGLASIGIAALSASASGRPMASLLLALASALALPFLLPHMHERYFFLADLLSIAAALSHPRKDMILLAGAVQLASLLSLVRFIFLGTWSLPLLVGAVLAGLAAARALKLALEDGASAPSFRTAAAGQPPASAERTSA